MQRHSVSSFWFFLLRYVNLFYSHASLLSIPRHLAGGNRKLRSCARQYLTLSLEGDCSDLGVVSSNVSYVTFDIRNVELTLVRELE